MSAAAAEILLEVCTTVNSHSVYSEREVLKLVPHLLEQLTAQPDSGRLAFVFAALARLPEAETIQEQLALKGMVSSLLRAGIAMSPAEAVSLVKRVSFHRVGFPYKAILTALAKVPASPELSTVLRRLRPHITEWHGGREMSDLHERLDALSGRGVGATSMPAAPVVIAAAGPWSTQVLSETAASTQELAWRALFLHIRLLTANAPSHKWLAEASPLIDRIGQAEFTAAATRWLALGPMPGDATRQVPAAEADYQLGFIWTLGALQGAALAPEIAAFALACFRKIPTLGAVSHRVGNACVNTLAAMPGLGAVSQLSLLAGRVKYDVARRLVEKALVETAARNGVSRDDLEAMSVPSFGLGQDGVRVENLGECQARLSIEAGGVAALTWFRATAGKPLKSVPAEVKASHAGLLAELKKAHKDLDSVLIGQRLRLERLLLSQSACPMEQWRAWYVDHPFTGHFARRLIWEIEEPGGGGEARTGIWHQGGLVDWTGAALPASPSVKVRLWHPIRSGVQTVLSWRCWLEDHHIRQPFKQAHREVYLLTEAERQTATYSNRFAAHIIKQHQFASLCRERGWHFTLMGPWDSHNTPYLELPQYNLRAAFDVDFPPNEEISGHAVYLQITTGRVSFTRLDAHSKKQLRERFAAVAAMIRSPEALHRLHPEPVPLAEIPPVVFSEVMRDGDLFTGVTSIGADPAWNAAAGHRDEAHQRYWQEFAFGELTTAAENRHTVLENLLPKLPALSDRCRLEGRFLCVRGNLHEYRIHLGSGNILMEPGSRYLCIVQGAGDSAASLPLPFEGDRILSMILSKALLLVNDTAITDESIRQQL